MKWNPWPYAIISYFVLFITGIAAWVTFAMRNDVQLVRPDYYEHEIQYQKQIDMLARTAPVRSEVKVIYNPTNETLVIGLPSGTDVRQVEGMIHLYRPSDAEFDCNIRLKLDEHGAQHIDTSGLHSGMWKVYLTWTDRGHKYYFEKGLFLRAG